MARHLFKEKLTNAIGGDSLSIKISRQSIDSLLMDINGKYIKGKYVKR